MGFIVVALVLFTVFVLPVLLGNLFARMLKLPDIAGRISLVLCALFCGLAPFVWPYVSYPFRESQYASASKAYPEQLEAYEEKLEKYKEEKREWIADGQLGDAPTVPVKPVEPVSPIKPDPQHIIRKGIDLAGGTNMVFLVDFDQLGEKKGVIDKAAAMDQMVGAIIRRINPSGTEEVVVRKVGVDRIEVIIPGKDPDYIEEKKDQMTRLGSLEFGILATPIYPEHTDLISLARASTDDIIRDEDGKIIARWHDVAKGSTGIVKSISLHGRVVSRPKLKADGKPDTDVEGNTIQQFLVAYEADDDRVTGKFLTQARVTQDQNGAPAVGFHFNSEGAARFRALTTKYRPRSDNEKYRLAVILDNKIHSAPNINTPIGADGIIEGKFTLAEVKELVGVLNAGALEVPIQETPVQEMTISPLLGADVIQKGTTAILAAFVLVMVFMLIYYMFSGLVANICLVMNIILVMGAMVFIKAAFTLPGLAGIVLTIGMAVDANVLIFERIREEIARGSSLKMAIQNGFNRAFTTIVDANVTTLLTAIVLYMIGTDQVKGFAVTLFIGIVMSMFTALYVGRLIFDIFERKRWIKKISMLSVVGKTNYNFISKQTLAAVASLVLIGIGFAALFARGSQMLGIDFTGGTMITFEVTEPTTSKKISDVLEPVFGSTITVERLSLTDEADDSDKGIRFRLRTIIRDHVNSPKQDKTKQSTENNEHVTGLLNKAFVASDLKLNYTTVQVGKVAKIDQPAKPENQTELDKQFAGGHQADLTFNRAVRKGLVTQKLVSAIENIKHATDDKPKYEEADKLVFAIETGGQAAKTASGATLRSDKWQIKCLPIIQQADLEAALSAMQHEMATSPTFEELSSFDSSVASEMQQSALMAMFISLIAIVGYIWFRFQRITFGLAAVVALVHDVLVVLGMVSIAAWLVGSMEFHALGLEEFKINLPMIAAFLTIVGYSLNDTIVVFDRIREVRGKNPDITSGMVNTSLNQTLSRTLLTSLTTFIVVAILYFFGGEGIHGFAFCLVVGVIVGTYSSIFVASPVLLWLMKRAKPENKQAAA